VLIWSRRCRAGHRDLGWWCILEGDSNPGDWLMSFEMLVWCVLFRQLDLG
jgi:hypothetical protein